MNNARRFEMRILGAILTMVGSVLLCGGSAGLMDGDPAGLILWMPGALLMIAGLLVLNTARDKSKKGKQEEERK
jgi:hypothetical protein